MTEMLMIILEILFAMLMSFWIVLLSSAFWHINKHFRNEKYNPKKEWRKW